MKELSIEQKAQRFDEAIKKARERYNKEYTSTLERSTLAHVFPELKESEDEKIRGAIMHFISHTPTVPKGIINKEQMLAWLEKQVSQDNTEDVDILHRFSFYSYKDEPNVLYLSGLYVNEEYRNKGIGTKILEVADEVVKSLNCRAIRLKTRKDSDAERLYRIHGYNSLATEDKDEIWLEKQGEQNPDEHKVVEPKFKVEDWVVNNNSRDVYKVTEIRDDEYCLWPLYGEIMGYLRIIDVDNEYHLWTIQDAKDGDVLADGNLPFIFKKIDTDKHSYAYCGISVDDGFKIESDGESGEWTWMQDIKPATKEQCDLLFKKMGEAGYVWDAEKKELNKIVAPKFKVGDTMRTLQEAANGVTDGLPVVISIDNEYYRCNNELIAIKDQDGYEYPPMNRRQNPAWSEEDEKMIESIIKALYGGGHFAYEPEITWLKSLRPQNRWKPSEEQMKALNYVVNLMASSESPRENDYYYNVFNDLRKQLKKLKEE